MNDYLIPFFQVCRDSDFLFFKVLSQNDKSWSWPKERPGYAHQGGVVVPDNCTRIFPRREVEEGAGAPHLLADRRYYRLHTYWVGDDGEWQENYEGPDWRKQSKFGRSYKDRQEFRITGGLPRDHFRFLAPGSLFVCARRSGSEFGKDYHFSCLTVDSQSDAYQEIIETMLLPDPPWAGLLDLRAFANPLVSTIAASSEIFRTAESRAVSGELITTAAELSKAAVRSFERQHDRSVLSLLRESPAPGDLLRLLMEESFAIVKDQQQRTYPDRIADLLWSAIGDGPVSRDTVLNALRTKVEEIRGVFKSMQNSIFSLAGSCFQNYVRLWMDAFEIPFEPQQKVDGDRTVDFVLPNAEFYWSDDRGRDDAILLAAKTSCRERWQQILAEGKLVDTRYLATLDNAVAERTLGKMQEDRVIVVVPESHKKSLEHYTAAPNVLNYATFMKVILIPKKRLWRADLR